MSEVVLAPGEEHYLRSFPSKPFAAVRGEGSVLYDEKGEAKIDFGGASHGTAILGHCHPAVVAAVRDQAGELMHVAQGIPSPVRGRFLTALHAKLPDELSRTFLTNSGTEALECGIKLARAATGRSRFVAAHSSFHGRSVGALSLTHKAAFRDPFAGILMPTEFVAYEEIEQLKAAVTKETAAIVLEPVQGEGGIRPASEAYLKAANDIAHDAGALLFLDEVQSGMGRTGSFLAASRLGVTPDITTLAKGLAGGLAAGACMTSAEVADKLPPGAHGSTYGGNPLICAAGLATLQVLDDEQLLARASNEGGRLMSALQDVQVVRDVKGVGMMIGVALKVRPQPVMQALFDKGYLVLAGGPQELRILPPLTATRDELDGFVAALGSS